MYSISKDILQRYLFNLYFLVDNYSIMMKMFLSTIEIKRFIYKFATPKCMREDKNSGLAKVSSIDETVKQCEKTADDFAAERAFAHYSGSDVGVLVSNNSAGYLKLVPTGEHCADGLHIRPLTKIHEALVAYQSNVYAKELKNNRCVYAKSILELLTLAVAQNTPIVFCFKYDGNGAEKQAKKVSEKLTKLFDNGFESAYPHPEKSMHL